MQILFFHNTACGSCDGTEEFRQAVEEQISYYKEEYPYELQMYNVFQTTGMQEWEKTAAEYDLENEEYIYPVMVLDGTMYRGMDVIKEQLHKAFLETCGVSAVYFYREDCEECQDMAPFWDSFRKNFRLQNWNPAWETMEHRSAVFLRNTRCRMKIRWFPLSFKGYLSGRPGIH